MSKTAVKLERVNAYKTAPDKLLIVGIDKYDAEHPLYDTRVERDVTPELIESMRHIGPLKPVIVWKEDGTGDYIVVDGRQRVRAARIVNDERIAKGKSGTDLLEVPFIIKEGTISALLAIASSANVGMEETMLDKAFRTQHMIKMGMSRADIAHAFGVSQMAISNYVKLLKASPEVLTALGKGYVTATTAMKFADLAVDKQSEALYNAVPELRPVVAAPVVDEAGNVVAPEASTDSAPVGGDLPVAPVNPPVKVSGRSASAAIAAVTTEAPTFEPPTTGELKRVYSITLKQLRDKAAADGHNKIKLPSWMAVLRAIVEGDEAAAPELVASIKMMREAQRSARDEAGKEKAPKADADATPADGEKRGRGRPPKALSAEEKAAQLAIVKAKAAAVQASQLSLSNLTDAVEAGSADAPVADSPVAETEAVTAETTA